MCICQFQSPNLSLPPFPPLGKQTISLFSTSVTLFLFCKCKKPQGRPSRWRKSKTWRSPSSPQIHQKYIYMWNNSYRTPTEHWQKTSDLPKGKKLPMYLGRVKEERKNRQKNRDGTCTSGRELWRRKGFHTLGSPFAGGDCGWRRGKASEPRRRAQQQGYRGQSGEIPAQRIGADQHSPDWETSLLTCCGGRGLWEGSGFGRIPGRGLGLAAWTQPEGG